MDSFWHNWQFRRTDMAGQWFCELSFFSNNFNHCENTLAEACNRLELTDFGIFPASGGGYTGIIFINSDQRETIGQ
jgi:hypothetical protein